MDSSAVFPSVALVVAAGYALLLLAILLREGIGERRLRPFLGFLAASALWELLLAVSPTRHIPANLLMSVLLGGTMLLVLTTTYYFDAPGIRRWILVGGAVIVALIVLELAAPAPLLPSATLVRLEPSSAGLLMLLLWLGTNAGLLLWIWQRYRHTELPWHANRLLHWALFLLLTFAGQLLILFRDPALFLFGQAISLGGVLGLGRAITSHHLFDVQSGVRRGMAFLLVALASLAPAAVLLGFLYVLAGVFGTQSTLAGVVFLFSIAAGLLLYQPYQRAMNRIIGSMITGDELETGQIVRGYGQAITRTLDVEQLSREIATALGELLGTSRGALMIVNHDEDGHQVEPVPGVGTLSTRPQQFEQISPFITAVKSRGAPLLQYELDFSPEFAKLSENEREWLTEQNMDVYLPVQSDGELGGLIAVGPKRSGLPYKPDELLLLQVLADQTVIALQNARLYSALLAQNQQIRQLNTELRQQNRRLEILDQVKTDFITIASHELRTPLTQAKGYADILEVMNEEQDLSREQIREIVGYIARATQRLETVITAMLDASELQVSGMDLSPMQTTLEAIVHQALHPVRAATAERHIKIVEQGLAGLPPLVADFKRLVQAFQNLIGNAIKYTPNYGTIYITAQLAPAMDDNEEYVHVVVADSGIGIPAEYHELIFEKFFRIGDPQLHSTGTTKFKGAGPGLGLHIVKGVVEAHGGSVWVESYREDEAHLPGSRFHVLLPLRITHAKSTAGASTVSQVPETVAA